MNANLSHPDIVAKKSELRRKLEALRIAAFAQNPDAGFALRDHFLKAIDLPLASIVASYSARGSEMNPAPLTAALRKRGHAIALPVMVGRDQPLLFRRYDADMQLTPNKFGIGEPPDDADRMIPDLVLVPLLGFTQNLARLGTGGGYYDRTLPELRRSKTVIAVGLGFACQENADIPIESHDVPLDRIVTELKVF